MGKEIDLLVGTLSLTGSDRHLKAVFYDDYYVF